MSDSDDSDKPFPVKQPVAAKPVAVAKKNIIAMDSDDSDEAPPIAAKPQPAKKAAAFLDSDESDGFVAPTR
jgi:hypothetical protein